MERYRELTQAWLMPRPASRRPPPSSIPCWLSEKMKVTHSIREVLRYRISFFFTDDYAYDPAAVEKTLRKPGALERLAQIAACYSAARRPSTPATSLEAKPQGTLRHPSA